MPGTATGRRQFRRLRIEQLEPRLALDASMLRITEFLASNNDGIRDADGDSSDWIEIFNSGHEQVDLSGIHLTDKADELDHWAFPSGTTLEAGGYLIVFASNKDTILAGDELHTNFAISADGEYLAIVDVDGATIIDEYVPNFPPQLEDISYGRAMQTAGDPTTLLASGAFGKALVPTNGALGTNWTQVDFNDASWPISGQTGFGYENSPGDPVNFTSQIGTTLPSGTTSAYVRVNIDLTSLVGIGKLTLGMKFDDGFVAYLNGVKVAEANAPDMAQWDSTATGLPDDAAALQFVDFDVSQAIPHLRVGANVLAIHALNVSTGSSDMLIVPELVAEPMSLVTPEMLGHFYVPTPGYGNGMSVAGFTAEPMFSVPHGFYSTPQTVSISTSTPGAVIVYTTNGSTPQVGANLNVINGVLYVNPLTISSTTTLRARAFKTDFEPSFAEASSYIFVDDVVNQSPAGQVPPGWPPSGVNGQEMDYGFDPDIVNLYGAQAVKDSLLSLSTFSITTDQSNLFDPSIGIYVNAGNRGRSWERPATVELIHSDGTVGFEVNAGLRIRGGYSRGGWNPKHAFRFYFRGEYGDAKLEYPLFGDEGTDEFDVLDLRSDQNYAWATHGDAQNSLVREVFGRDTQAALGSQYTRSRSHHLYINGVYWGVFMTQERVQKDFGESYYGGDDEDYDVIKVSPGYTIEVSDGNDLAWRQLFDYAQALQAAPQTNADLYWTMQGLNPDGTRNTSLPVLLDVDNVINYMLVVFYTGGFDSGLSQFLGDNGPNNYFAIYNRVTADRGFNFFIHDNEHSLGVNGTVGIDRTGPFNNGNQDSYPHSNPQYLHQDLMAHPEYKQRFIDQVQKHFFNGGALTPAESIARLMERVDQVDPAIIAEAARWGDAKVAVPRNKSHWQAQINWLVNIYLPQRGNIVLNQLRVDGLYTPFAAPAFSQHGGTVPTGYPLTITATTSGTIYYTTDGVTDPRAIGGLVNPSAAVNVYSGPASITGPTTVKARLRTAEGQWSGLVEATFDPLPLPGDYNNDGLVEETDYLVWRANFGSSVQPGTSADGNGDGLINAADYTVWRDNLGASIGLAQTNSETSVAFAAAELPSIDDSTENDLGLSEPRMLAFAADSETRTDRWNSPWRSFDFRPEIRGPIHESARDLLLTANLSQGLRSVSDSSNSSRTAVARQFDPADISKTAEHTLDELFSTLADDCDFKWTALLREFS